MKRPIVTIGDYGYRVAVVRLRGRQGLYLRWWDSSTQRMRWKALKHQDEERAEQQARAFAASLLAATEAARDGRLPLELVFTRYERDVTTHRKPSQAIDDRRRMDVWEAVLGAQRDVRTITHQELADFVRARKAGSIVVPWRRGTTDEEAPPRRLRARPSATTIGADIAFLSIVLNWATRLMSADGLRLLEQNPIRGYAIPKTATPRRPVASYDRFEQLRAAADQVDPQRRFGAFLDLVEALGWRVSALCQLRGEDIDRKKRAQAPSGRIRKRGELDKEGVEMWVPLPTAARAALDRIPVLGGWLFPSPRRAGKPWTRHHADDLLRRAEAKAELEHLAGGAFHPYRRKWATERKHLPDADVMAAGGWKDPRSLKQSYQQVDDATLLAVVSEPRKLREAK